VSAAAADLKRLRAPCRVSPNSGLSVLNGSSTIYFPFSSRLWVAKKCFSTWSSSGYNFVLRWTFSSSQNFWSMLSISIVVVSAIALLAFDVLSEVITHPNTDEIAIRLPLLSYIIDNQTIIGYARLDLQRAASPCRVCFYGRDSRNQNAWCRPYQSESLDVFNRRRHVTWSPFAFLPYTIAVGNMLRLISVRWVDFAVPCAHTTFWVPAPWAKWLSVTEFVLDALKFCSSPSAIWARFPLSCGFGWTWRREWWFPFHCLHLYVDLHLLTPWPDRKQL